MRVLLLITAFICVACGSIQEDKQHIAATLHRQLDRPNTDLEIDPIVVRQSYALAGWVQGESGGRVLMHREHGKWSVVVVAGVELRDAQYLKQAGMSQQEASALANMLITAERRVPEARLAQFDRYGDATIRR